MTSHLAEGIKAHQALAAAQMPEVVMLGDSFTYGITAEQMKAKIDKLKGIIKYAKTQVTPMKNDVGVKKMKRHLANLQREYQAALNQRKKEETNG